jgi:hypothetical protein
MSVYTNTQFQSQYAHALRCERKGDIGLSYIKRAEQFSWFDKAEITAQSKAWRQLAVQGKFKIGRYNNKERTHDGRTWYFLVGQPYKTNGKMEECSWDPFGLFILGEMVSGFIYAFKTAQNRDAIYSYVMKDIEEPPAHPTFDDEEDDDSVADTESLPDDEEPEPVKGVKLFCAEHTYGPIDCVLDCPKCRQAKELADLKERARQAGFELSDTKPRCVPRADGKFDYMEGDRNIAIVEPTLFEKIVQKTGAVQTEISKEEYEQAQARQNIRIRVPQPPVITGTCCLCGGGYTFTGNNPYPVSKNPNDKCCDTCNSDKVIPARLAGFGYKPEPKVFRPTPKPEPKKEMTEAEIDALCAELGPAIGNKKEKTKSKKELQAEATREANKIKKEEEKKRREWEHISAESANRKHEERVAKQKEIEKKKRQAFLQGKV